MAYSSTTYTADGIAKDFPVVFDYLDESHVLIRVNKVFTSEIGSEYSYEFINSTTIRVVRTVDSEPVPAGLSIEFIRRTPIDTPAVVFGGGASLSSVNLNKNSEYLTYALQEATDANEEFTKLYLGSFSTAPTTDNDGDVLNIGAAYFNTALNALQYWSGTEWITGDSVFLAEAAQEAAEAAQAAAEAAQGVATTKANEAAASADAAAISETNAAASAIAAATWDPANYARKDVSNTFTASQILAASVALTTLQIRSRASDSIHDISVRDSAGNTANAWDFRTQATAAGNFQLRHNGAYLVQVTSNGAMTLGGTAGTLISGQSGVVSNGELQIRSDGNNAITFRSAGGATNGLMYLNRGAASVDRPGLISWNLYDPDGSDSRVVGVLADTIAKGGDLSGAQYIVTREHGDVRYVLDQDAVKQDLTVFNGDLNTLFGPGQTRTYQVGTSATNSPAAVNGSLFVQQHPTLGNFLTQTFIEQSSVSPRQWYRARASGIWSAWAELGTKANTLQVSAPTTLFTGDLDTVLETGITLVNTSVATNVPESNLNAILETIRGDDTDDVIQRMSYVFGGKVYTRQRWNGLWFSWSLNSVVHTVTNNNSRTVNTAYQNNQNTSEFVSVDFTITSGRASLQVSPDNVTWKTISIIPAAGTGTTSVTGNRTCMVPPGHYWRFNEEDATVVINRSSETT